MAKRTVTVIVSGQETRLTIDNGREVGLLSIKALILAGMEPEQIGWEMRDADGKLLEQGVRIRDYNIKNGQVLYLSPKAGTGA